jgi:hypothetical protein
MSNFTGIAVARAAIDSGMKVNTDSRSTWRSIIPAIRSVKAAMVLPHPDSPSALGSDFGDRLQKKADRHDNLSAMGLVAQGLTVSGSWIVLRHLLEHHKPMRWDHSVDLTIVHL